MLDATTASTLQFPELLDSTILAAYDSCPRKAYNQFFLHLASKRPSVHLHAGGAFARAVEIARRKYWFAKQSPEAAIYSGLRAFISYWGLEDFDSEAKDFINTAGAYLDYFREYPLQADPISPYIMAGDRPAIEFTFAIPLPIIHPQSGQPILYGGRMDLIGYYNHFLCIVDEKTTSGIGPKWAEQWSMRGQFLGYSWAAQQHHIPAKTVLVRGIGILKTEYKHAQAIIQIEDWRIEHWYENMLNRVRAMIHCFELHQGNPDWPHSFPYSYGDACQSYGGCMFTDLCKSRDPSIWYDSFGRKMWNPLALDPTREEKV